MNPIVLIPARMASTRLPGKPLADIVGKPMIVRVWEQAVKAAVGPVVVAAAESVIVDVIESVGGQAVLTSPGLASGTDRIAQALARVDPASQYDVVVNLQGDLPTLNPGYVNTVLEALTGFDMATLAAEIDNPDDRTNPNVPKPVVAWETDGKIGRALYFTRATAPSGEGPLFFHIGIYAFTRSSLVRFVALGPSVLEKRERLEQLRALEAQMSIAVARVDSVPLSVDTPADLEKARRLLK